MAFTYFFRDMQTLDLIVKHVVPVITGYKYINIWDAGCAHGPEPYSIAMLLRENMSHFLFRNVRIYASDLDESNTFGDIIRQGIYPSCELKRIPGAIRRRYFAPAGRPGYFRIADEIRARVTFQQHDLLSLKPLRHELALVVCKNVLLHLAPWQQVQVVSMFHAALANGGFLLLEQTQDMPPPGSRLFERVTTEGKLFRKVGSVAFCSVEASIDGDARATAAIL